MLRTSSTSGRVRVRVLADRPGRQHCEIELSGRVTTLGSAPVVSRTIASRAPCSDGAEFGLRLRTNTEAHAPDHVAG